MLSAGQSMDSAVETKRTRADDTVRIERAVRALLARSSARAAVRGPAFARLWELASQHVLGGKLLRPRLLLGAFDALASDSADRIPCTECVLRLAAGIELLHFSFLLHDDVIDEDLLRRGRANLIGMLLEERGPGDVPAARNPARPGADLHWARANGILLGDLMLSAAHQTFARESLPEGVRLRLLELLEHAIAESVAGEQLDVGLSDGVIASDLGTVLEMSRRKTAVYTFELPLRAAAILAGQDQRTEREIAAIGTHLGVAFQLQDDLLSTFGRAAEHGKDPYSDLREAKETAIIAYARMTSAWSRIEPWFGRADLGEEEGRALRDVLVECGAERFIRSLIEDEIRTALDLVASPESAVPPELARFMLRLVDSLEERRS